MNGTDLGFIEGQRQKIGVGIVKLCKEASVAPSTYTRWLQTLRTGTGPMPNLRTLSAVKNALHRLESVEAA